MQYKKIGNRAQYLKELIERQSTGTPEELAARSESLNRCRTGTLKI